MTNEVKILRNVPRLLKHAASITPNASFPDDAFIRRLSVALDGLRECCIFTASNPQYPEDLRMIFANRLKIRALELGVYEKAPEPLLTGRFLMTLGLKPSKQFGELIHESFEFQLDGTLQNAEQAEAWARTKLGF